MYTSWRFCDSDAVYKCHDLRTYSLTCCFVGYYTVSGKKGATIFLATTLQGSVGTCVNYGRIFIDFFTANILKSVKVKEF